MALRVLVIPGAVAAALVLCFAAYSQTNETEWLAAIHALIEAGTPVDPDVLDYLNSIDGNTETIDSLLSIISSDVSSGLLIQSDIKIGVNDVESGVSDTVAILGAAASGDTALHVNVDNFEDFFSEDHPGTVYQSGGDYPSSANVGDVLGAQNPSTNSAYAESVTNFSYATVDDVLGSLPRGVSNIVVSCSNEFFHGRVDTNTLPDESFLESFFFLDIEQISKLDISAIAGYDPGSNWWQTVYFDFVEFPFLDASIIVFRAVVSGLIVVGCGVMCLSEAGRTGGDAQ